MLAALHSLFHLGFASFPPMLLLVVVKSFLLFQSVLLLSFVVEQTTSNGYDLKSIVGTLQNCEVEAVDKEEETKGKKGKTSSSSMVSHQDFPLVMTFSSFLNLKRSKRTLPLTGDLEVQQDGTCFLQTQGAFGSATTTHARIEAFLCWMRNVALPADILPNFDASVIALAVMVAVPLRQCDTPEGGFSQDGLDMVHSLTFDGAIALLCADPTGSVSLSCVQQQVWKHLLQQVAHIHAATQPKGKWFPKGHKFPPNPMGDESGRRARVSKKGCNCRRKWIRKSGTRR